MTHQDPPITLATCHAFELSGLPRHPQTLMISDGKGGWINALAFQEVLEALESAADELERLMSWHGTEVWPSVLRDARAAIAKARGAQ
jgi:hypothetical protein